MISSVTGRQLGDFRNIIQPALLGVVNATSAVSARTLTCRAPAASRSCSMLSVYMAVRVRPFAKLPPLAVPLEGLQEELRHRCLALVGIKYIYVVGPEPGTFVHSLWGYPAAASSR